MHEPTQCERDAAAQQMDQVQGNSAKPPIQVARTTEQLEGGIVRVEGGMKGAPREVSMEVEEPERSEDVGGWGGMYTLSNVKAFMASWVMDLDKEAWD